MVQLGGAIGRSIIAGVVGEVIRPDSSTLRAGEVDAPLSGKPAVLVSAVSEVVAFRADAVWRVM